MNRVHMHDNEERKCRSAKIETTKKEKVKQYARQEDKTGKS